MLLRETPLPTLELRPLRSAGARIGLSIWIGLATGCTGQSSASDTDTDTDTDTNTSGPVSSTGFGSASTTASGTSTTGSTSGSSGGSESSTDDSSSTGAATSESSTETGAASTTSTGEESGCAAVDILFVIDNSASIQAVQTRLVNAIPGFLSLLEDTLGDTDMQLGVVTTDAYEFNSPGCDGLGGLVVQTGGIDSSNAACGPYEEGNNFMTGADDLAEVFECAAQVGTSGLGIERPMAAMEAAIGDTLGADGACNQGFVRDEAMLLIFVITDEFDGPEDPELDGSPGTPASWHQAVLDAKNGQALSAAAVVFTNFEGGTCPPDSQFSDGSNLVDFAGLFGSNGLAVGICEDDYTQNLADAAVLIGSACDGFVGG